MWAKISLYGNRKTSKMLQFYDEGGNVGKTEFLLKYGKYYKGGSVAKRLKMLEKRKSW